MDVVRVDVAWLNERFDFGDRYLPRHGADGVEVARRLIEHQVPEGVAFGRPDEGEIAGDGLLEDELALAETTALLCRRGHGDRAVWGETPRQASVGHLGADSGGRVEPGDTGPAGPQPLSERALGDELHLELPTHVAALEIRVLAYVRARHTVDPAVRQEQAEPPAFQAAIVRHDPQVVRPELEDRFDEGLRDAAGPKTTDSD